MGSGSPKTPPLVSVIMPTYNHSEFIADAIESVCKQTLNEFELIVVDDGSTDGTPEILAGIRDERIRCLRTTNRGRSAARNLGLERASGRYLAFLDSDDLYHPDKLRLQVELLERNSDVTFCFHDFNRFSDEGPFEHTHFHFIPEVRNLPARPVREIPSAYLLEGDAFHLLAPLQMLAAWLQTLMVRRDVVKHFGFDEGLIHSTEDLAYALRCYQRGRAAYIDRCLASLRRHDRNSFSDPFYIILPKIDALNIIQGEIQDSHYQAIIRRRLGDEWRSYGYYGRLRGDRKTTITGYARSLSFPGRRLNSLAHLGLALVCPFPSLFSRFQSGSKRDGPQEPSSQ